ncbi:hypothetical protein LTR85_005562 [Meristemomyces frigidus]|nr:hypothetical protein LTR85_005562 [Meristemomyces frigidus]
MAQERAAKHKLGDVDQDVTMPPTKCARSITSPSRSAQASNPADAQPLTRLLGLPPELRNQFYEYASLTTQPNDLLAGDPPLSRTCRQLRAEMLDVYYATSAFSITLPTGCGAKLFQRAQAVVDRIEELRKRTGDSPLLRHLQQKRLHILFRLHNPHHMRGGSCCSDHGPEHGQLDFRALGEALAKCGVTRKEQVMVDVQVVYDDGETPKPGQQERRARVAVGICVAQWWKAFRHVTWVERWMLKKQRVQAKRRLWKSAKEARLREV